MKYWALWYIEHRLSNLTTSIRYSTATLSQCNNEKEDYYVEERNKLFTDEIMPFIENTKLSPKQLVDIINLAKLQNTRPM